MEKVRFKIYQLYIFLVGSFFSIILGSKYDRVLPSQRGNNRFFNHKEIVNIFLRENGVKPRSCLILGCGNGKDVDGLVSLGFEEIIGVDLFDFSEEFKFLKQRHEHVDISFIKGDLSDVLITLGNAGIGVDVIISDAVVEHLRWIFTDVDNIVRYLKWCNERSEINTLFYSCFGPIWHAFGGDHFSGGRDESQGGDHLHLDDALYQESYDGYVGSCEGVFEGIWTDEGLFSFLREEDYWILFNRNFKVIASKAILDFRCKNCAVPPDVRMSLVSGIMFVCCEK